MIHIDRPTLTTAAVRLVARRTPYLEPEVLGLDSLVGPGGVGIDIGSASGVYTLALSRLVGATGQVHSVEALPLAFVHPFLTRLLRARSAPNVRHHTLALGAEPGSGVMSVPIGRYGPVTGRSFLARKTTGLGSNAEFAEHVDVMVKVDTLDSLCTRAGLTRLDFVKIDVEGAELQVLEGGTRTIEKFRPALLVEIEARHTDRYQYSPDAIVGWFAARDYTMHVWRDGWQETGAVRPETRNYLFRPAA